MSTHVPAVQGAMPRPPSDAVQVALRIPVSWLARADELAKQISRPGFEASRTDAFRAAIARGFEVFDEDLRAELLAARERAPEGTGDRGGHRVVSRTRDIIDKKLADLATRSKPKPKR